MVSTNPDMLVSIGDHLYNGGFLDRAVTNYRPAAGSDLVSAGDNAHVLAGERDHWGRDRLQDEVEVGAFERSAGDP